MFSNHDIVYVLDFKNALQRLINEAVEKGYPFDLIFSCLISSMPKLFATTEFHEDLYVDFMKALLNEDNISRCVKEIRSLRFIYENSRNE